MNPSLTEAHYHLAWLYEILGPEWEQESLVEGDRTRELTLLSPFMAVNWPEIQNVSSHLIVHWSKSHAYTGHSAIIVLRGC
ncbi:MAG: hypothetical protein KJP16_06085 [Gammaproteobacteria bacterium]|nr:hypothetical protein [Gammaproteobacteria bacterium]NNL50371.1 hypothetical protein [Woeseiaceae bacterium]